MTSLIVRAENTCLQYNGVKAEAKVSIEARASIEGERCWSRFCWFSASKKRFKQGHMTSREISMLHCAIQIFPWKSHDLEGNIMDIALAVPLKIALATKAVSAALNHAVKWHNAAKGSGHLLINWIYIQRCKCALHVWCSPNWATSTCNLYHSNPYYMYVTCCLDTVCILLVNFRYGTCISTCTWSQSLCVSNCSISFVLWMWRWCMSDGNFRNQSKSLNALLSLHRTKNSKNYWTMST